MGNGDGGLRGKLVDGVLLILLHPEVAGRSCAECNEWVFDEETGRKVLRCGRPVPRNGAPTRCRAPGGTCPKGTPESPIELTEQNRRVWRHYLECRATGQWPDDALVREHAAVLRAVEDHVEAVRQDRRAAALIQATAIGTIGGGARGR